MANQQITIKSSGKKGSAGFSPTPLKASPGDTVAWVNQDVIQHWPTPNSGPAWFNQAINPNITSVPISVPQTTDYHCKIHPTEKGSITVAGAPQIVKLTIVAGSLPSKTINANDSVFWFNDTNDKYELVYNPPAPAQPVRWGVPPDPLPPKQTSSQVVFPKAGSFTYHCKLHPGQKGTITVL
jgi:plastocyanin